MTATATAACAVLLFVGTGCSSGGDERASTDTTISEKTTVAPDTTGQASTTTTLGAPPPAGAVPFVDLATASPNDGVSPAGSGCAPGTITTLPDGSWFGALRSIDAAAGTLGLDLECLYTGDAANAAATAAGEAEVPVPNDVYVRNESPTVRTLHVVPDVAVAVVTLELVGGVQFEPTKTGLAAADSLVDHPVWIDVKNSWVVAIQEQYFP
jgi:hypothetical protein